MATDRWMRVLDEQERRQICAVLSMGGTRQVAAWYVGCLLGAIRRTAALVPQFHLDLCRAQAQHELAQLNVLRDAARSEKNWRAGVWILEHRYPERYGRRKPKPLTTYEISLLLKQFSEIVVEELPSEFVRDRLLARFGRLADDVWSEP